MPRALTGVRRSRPKKSFYVILCPSDAFATESGHVAEGRLGTRAAQSTLPSGHLNTRAHRADTRRWPWSHSCCTLVRFRDLPHAPSGLPKTRDPGGVVNMASGTRSYGRPKVAFAIVAKRRHPGVDDLQSSSSNGLSASEVRLDATIPQAATNLTRLLTRPRPLAQTLLPFRSQRKKKKKPIALHRLTASHANGMTRVLAAQPNIRGRPV